MIEFLTELDKVLFVLINSLLASPVTDTIMPIITSDNVLRLVFIGIIIALLWKGDKRQRWLVLFAGFAIFATDQLSAGVLKPWIERVRPCHVFDDINLLVGCGSGFSMPSAHATNVFGQAALLSAHVRHSAWPLYVFAVIVALSRVFVGVHYPGDIFVGAMLGLLVGKIISRIFKSFCRVVLTDQKETPEETDAIPD